MTSPSISTWMPPRPNAISGPKRGSSVTPTITSMPPEIIGCTTTPSIASTLPFLWRLLRMLLNPLTTLSRSGRFNNTPPISVLCTRLCDASLIATGNPILSEMSAASSGVVAIPPSGNGSRMAERTPRLSEAESQPAPRCSIARRQICRAAAGSTFSTAGITPSGSCRHSA